MRIRHLGRTRFSRKGISWRTILLSRRPDVYTNAQKGLLPSRVMLPANTKDPEIEILQIALLLDLVY